MRRLLLVGLMMALSVVGTYVSAQLSEADSLRLQAKSDSIYAEFQNQLQRRLSAMDSIRVADSLARVELEHQLEHLRTTDNLQKQDILDQLESLRLKERSRIQSRVAYIDSLRLVATGFPVLGVLGDTITTVYVRQGAFSPKERAQQATRRVRQVYDDDFTEADSLTLSFMGGFADIMYGDHIVMTITDHDALWESMTTEEYTTLVRNAMQESLQRATEETSLKRVAIRILAVVAIILVMVVLLFLLGKLFKWLTAWISKRKETLFKELKYNDYTFLTVNQMEVIVDKAITLLHWVAVGLLFIFVLPILLSIFPYTRGWSDKIFHALLTPFNNILTDIWNYLPKFLNIVIIVLVMKYVVRFVKYIFSELEANRLRIPGFHPEFAKPTFVLVRALLVVFSVILIYPYLPGSGSQAFNGISVFVGLLVSLGSSSAIANMIAGLVITYMRPFKVGDRIKIDGIVGDVTEKNMLVTKIKQVTNEEVTIPNSKVLNSNTINYSALVETKGLILSTTVTFGYEVPWQLVEKMMLEAISRCPLILPSPKPFLLQMSFADFYVNYTINGYTVEANKQASIYSQILGHIQDVCREYNVELLSPIYQANRDGSPITVPPEYHPPVEEEEEKPVPKVGGE